ncbi:MAG: hypothetical protein E7137_08190 [Rikenellaceae bacterium]|nr:hypothetical protein [Rikenellaceae bacterium]
MKKLLTLLAMLLLLMTWSCGSGGDDVVSPDDGKTEQPDDAYITLNKENITFAPDGESIDIKVYSNYAWKLTNNCDWVTTSVTNGEASEEGTTITLTADVAYDDREGTITFSCGKAKKLLVVSQSFKEAIIAGENNSFNLPFEGGTVEIAYQTTVECEVVIPKEAQGWISLADDTKALVSEKATLTVAENTIGERSAVVKVVAKNNSELMAEYTITQESSYRLEYTTYDGEVIKPNMLSEYPFGDANIVSNTYKDGEGVIVFDRELVEIGAEAFLATSLTSVTIPNSVTSIGAYAFVATNLTSVTIPDRVTEIGVLAFAGYQLTEFKGKYASEDGRCLVVDGVLNSFAPAGLTEYTIPEGVTSIGREALSAQPDLRSITIPDGVTSIGDMAFGACTSLISITIPDSVTEIGSYAFKDCTSLPVEDNIRYADTYLVEATTDTETISIKEGTRFIGEFAFAKCTTLTSVYCLPTTPPTISQDFFLGYASELKIYVPFESLDAYRTNEGWRDYESKIYPIPSPTNEIWYTSDDGEVVKPESTNQFGATLQSNTYTNGKGVMLFDGPVTEIGYKAFFYCTSLSKITIPNSVTSIGCEAFSNCINLTSITIPDSVTSIAEYAFVECASLKWVTIGNGVTSIGYEAFFYCNGLTSVYCKPTTPPGLVLTTTVDGTHTYWGGFSGAKKLKTIYVPEESVEAYKTAIGWGEYANYIFGDVY